MEKSLKVSSKKLHFFGKINGEISRGCPEGIFVWILAGFYGWVPVKIPELILAENFNGIP